MVSEHDFDQNLEQNFEELACGNYVTVMLVVANIIQVTLRGVRYALACRLLSLRILRGSVVKWFSVLSSPRRHGEH